MKKIFVAMLLALGLFGGNALAQDYAEKGYRELKGEELKAMLSGNTEESSTGSFYFHDVDGTFRGKSGQSGRFNQGEWWMNEEGRVCRNWIGNKYVPRGCSKIYMDDKTGDIQWYDTDGKWYGTKFHKGNVKGY